PAAAPGTPAQALAVCTDASPSWRVRACRCRLSRSPRPGPARSSASLSLRKNPARRHHLAVVLPVVYDEMRQAEAENVLVVITISDRWPFPTRQAKERFHASGRLADPGRRAGHTSISADQVTKQASRSDCREISTHRYSRIQLHPLRSEPHLRPHAVQLREPASTHLQHVQV